MLGAGWERSLIRPSWKLLERVLLVCTTGLLCSAWPPPLPTTLISPLLLPTTAFISKPPPEALFLLLTGAFSDWSKLLIAEVSMPAGELVRMERLAFPLAKDVSPMPPKGPLLEEPGTEFRTFCCASKPDASAKEARGDLPDEVFGRAVFGDLWRVLWRLLRGRRSSSSRSTRTIPLISRSSTSSLSSWPYLPLLLPLFPPSTAFDLAAVAGALLLEARKEWLGEMLGRDAKLACPPAGEVGDRMFSVDRSSKLCDNFIPAAAADVLFPAAAWESVADCLAGVKVVTRAGAVAAPALAVLGGNAEEAPKEAEEEVLVSLKLALDVAFCAAPVAVVPVAGLVTTKESFLP